MISCDAVRAMALSLPEAEECDHLGRPSFRVRDKVFATLWELEARAVLKLSPDAQDALVASDPRTFLVGPGSNQGWTGVELATIDLDLFRDLLVGSWRQIAPRRIVAAYDDRH